MANTPLFINRSEELNWLSNDIQSIPRKKVRIIKSNSGVGKSALCGELLDRHCTGFSIKVPITQFESTSRAGWGYLVKITIAIDQAAPQKYRFKNFLVAWGTEESRALLARQIFSTASSTLKLTAISDLKDRFFGNGNFDLKELASGEGAAVYRLLQEYLIWVAQSQPIALNVENIQAIDLQSLQALAHFISKSVDAYLLLEYTQGAKTETINIWELKNTFSALGVDVQEISLKPLKLKHAINLLSHVEGGVEKILEESYAEIKGNLRKLIDVDIQFALDPDSSRAKMIANSADMLNQSTSDNIEMLSNELDRYVLMIIYVHGGEILRQQLLLLPNYQKTEEFGIGRRKIEASLKRLTHHFLIENSPEGNKIRLAQDTIGDVLETSNRFARHRILAFDFIRKMYEDQGQLSASNFFISPADRIVILLRCYLEIEDPGRALRLTDEIAHVVLRSNQVGMLSSYLQRIYVAIKSYGNEDSRAVIASRLVKFYHYLMLPAKALEILETINNSDPDHLLARASLLDLALRHNEALDQCENALSSLEQLSPSQTLKFQLVRLSSLRLMNRHQEVDSLFQELIEAWKGSGLDEVGFLFRNAELTRMSTEEIINYNFQGIELFRSKGRSLDEARSCISISLHMSKQRRFKDAKDLLLRAEEIVLANPIERHYLYNNLAGINLRSGELGDQTVAWLETADTFAEIPFDRLIVTMNQLALFAQLPGRTPDAIDAAEEIESILDSGKPEDKEIRKIAFYNLALFNKRLGNSAKAHLLIGKARAIHHGFRNEWWDTVLRRAEDKDVIDLFEITFLSYWTVDFIELE